MKTIATLSILTTDLDRLDPDKRAARLEGMKRAAAKTAYASHMAVGIEVKTNGAVTSVIAYTDAR